MTNFSRSQLKAALWDERMDYEHGSPLCDVCGQPMLSGAMHESIVRRGVARGWSKEGKVKIFAPCNCHLVHYSACHTQAHADPDLMVAIQIVRYGYNVILEWIESLPFRVPFAWSRGFGENEALEMVQQKAPWILRQN